MWMSRVIFIVETEAGKWSIVVHTNDEQNLFEVRIRIVTQPEGGLITFVGCHHSLHLYEARLVLVSHFDIMIVVNVTGREGELIYSFEASSSNAILPSIKLSFVEVGEPE